MTLPEVMTSQKPRPNILRMISAGLFLVTAIMSSFNGSFSYLGQILQNPQTSGFASVPLYHYVIVQVLLPIGSLALAVTGFLPKIGKAWLWSAIGFFAFTVPLSWIMLQVYFQILGYPMDFLHFQITENNGFLDTAILIALCLASALAVVSRFVGNLPTTASSTQVPSESVSGGAPSNLPVFALVGSFVFSPAGVFLGHMAISQMKRGQISSANRSLAVAGLVIGYIFTVISLISVIFVLALLYQFGYLTARYW